MPNAIKNPSRPATNVRTITSLAMLAAIAYVVMLLSKMLHRCPASCRWT